MRSAFEVYNSKYIYSAMIKINESVNSFEYLDG